MFCPCPLGVFVTIWCFVNEWTASLFGVCVNAVLVLVIKNLELTNQKILVRCVARRTEYFKAVIQPLTTGTASPWYHK